MDSTKTTSLASSHQGLRVAWCILRNFFVRGHWTEWEAWKSPQKMFPLNRGTGLFWSIPGVLWSTEAIEDQVDKELEGPEWAWEATSDQEGSCYQWSLWCIFTAIIKSVGEKDSVMCWDLPCTRDKRSLQPPLLSEHSHLPALERCI